MGLDKALKAADKRPGGLSRPLKQLEGTFTCVLDEIQEDIVTSTKAEGVFLVFKILEGTKHIDQYLVDKLFFNQDGSWTVHQERLLQLARVFGNHTIPKLKIPNLIFAMNVIRDHVGLQVEVTTKWISDVRTPYMKFSYHNAG